MPKNILRWLGDHSLAIVGDDNSTVIVGINSAVIIMFEPGKDSNFLFAYEGDWCNIFLNINHSGGDFKYTNLSYIISPPQYEHGVFYTIARKELAGVVYMVKRTSHRLYPCELRDLFDVD